MLHNPTANWSHHATVTRSHPYNLKLTNKQQCLTIWSDGGTWMAITKREVAEQLGVAKQTVVNYIDRLGLAPEHVTRVGKTDVLDDFAVSALADALGKNIPPRPAQEEQASAAPVGQDSVIAALNARIADLKEQNDRLVSELAELRASRERELADMRSQLDAANDRAARLADRVAGIAERQQAISALPWWKRSYFATKLLGSGSE